MVENESLLAIYLNDHLAGSAAGIAAFRRVRDTHGASETGLVLDGLVHEVEEDREELRSIMRRFGFRERRYKVVLGGLGDKLGRLKLNGHVLTRSPLSDLVEFEGLLLAVQGKTAGFRTLAELAVTEPRLDGERLAGLIVRAERQAETLEALRSGP